MSTLASDIEELRVGIERLRTLLENLIVRGLRACGPDELGQLQSYTEHLERTGAGHIASLLAALHTQIQAGDRASAQTLLEAQTAVRLLERLLTLRVVGEHYQTAVQLLEHTAVARGTAAFAAPHDLDEGDTDDDDDDAEEEEG